MYEKKYLIHRVPVCEPLLFITSHGNGSLTHRDLFLNFAVWLTISKRLQNQSVGSAEHKIQDWQNSIHQVSLVSCQSISSWYCQAFWWISGIQFRMSWKSRDEKDLTHRRHLWKYDYSLKPSHILDQPYLHFVAWIGLLNLHCKKNLMALVFNVSYDIVDGMVLLIFLSRGRCKWRSRFGGWVRSEWRWSCNDTSRCWLYFCLNSLTDLV